MPATAVLSRAAMSVITLLSAAFLAWLVMVLALLLADIAFWAAGQGGGSIAIVAFITLPFWLLGLPIVGGAVWAVADRWAPKSARNALFIGAGVAALCATAVLQILIPALDPAALLSKGLIALSAASGGAVAGWVIWELAYRRTATRS